MKKNLILFVLFTLFLSQISCSQKESFVETNVKAIINKNFNEFQYLLIVPESGCGNCINEATSYIISNSSKLDNVLIIFTGVRDKKMLQQTVHFENFDSNNVFIDDENLFLHENISSIYPQVAPIINGRINELEQFSADKIEL